MLGLQPVLVHLSKNKSGKFSFNPVSVNLLTELAKTTFAFCVLLALVSRRVAVVFGRSQWRLRTPRAANARIACEEGLGR
jgi:hypothetical protein